MSTLDEIKDMAARAAGLDPSQKAQGRCVKCKEPFTEANVFTPLGWKETKISGMCEKCWDEMFSED